MVTDIYKIQLTELSPPKKAYLMLKYPKIQIMNIIEGGSYLIDKIKAVVNTKGEIVLVSTTLTTMIEYSILKAEDEDSMSVNSFDAKDEDEYYYNDGQNKREK